MLKWCVQSLLSKVKGTINIRTTQLYNYDNAACNSNFNFTNSSTFNAKVLDNYTWQWVVNLSWKLRDSWNWWEFTGITYSWNVSEISHSFYWYSQYTISAKINWTWTIILNWTKYSWRSWESSNATASYTFQIPWTSSNENRWPARILWLLGEIWSYTSFWRHIDWSWITWS